jgi:hypothetical protein
LLQSKLLLLPHGNCKGILADCPTEVNAKDRLLGEIRCTKAEAKPGVGGEGLLGVGIAAMAAYAATKETDPWEIGHRWLGDLAPLAGLVVWFVNRCRRTSPEV